MLSFIRLQQQLKIRGLRERTWNFFTFILLKRMKIVLPIRFLLIKDLQNYVGDSRKLNFLANYSRQDRVL